ncbi:hypothetical protein [Bosea sp. AK1]|uniref:hypothetical protein n=1 Tax=Bosea sp. AK1 TaxID=2587160 RepID=UPI000DE5544C|nr:hypothetical protein [Bosea sp. AK1]
MSDAISPETGIRCFVVEKHSHCFIASRYVVEAYGTKARGEFIALTVIILPAVDLDFSVIEENDMANGPVVQKDMIADKTPSLHLTAQESASHSCRSIAEACLVSRMVE